MWLSTRISFYHPADTFPLRHKLLPSSPATFWFQFRPTGSFNCPFPSPTLGMPEAVDSVPRVEFPSGCNDSRSGSCPATAKSKHLQRTGRQAPSVPVLQHTPNTDLRRDWPQLRSPGIGTRGDSNPPYGAHPPGTRESVRIPAPAARPTSAALSPPGSGA